jgi:VAD1 Analog of StAR-related lipid transfer domain
MTAFVIPNAIQITTRTTKYTFASFLARDTAHDVIFNIWRLSRPEDGLSEDETSGGPALDAPQALRTASPTELVAVSTGSVAPLSHKVTTCACEREGEHYSALAIDTVIPGTPERIYNLMFASGFLKDFMRENQKLEGKFSFFFFSSPLPSLTANMCADIQISDWAPTPGDQNCLARNMSYIKRLSGSIGPKATKCEIRDETLHCDFEDYVTMLTTTRTPDVPSGGVFSVKTRTCVTWASSASSRIVVTSQVEWTGRSFIKGARVMICCSPLFSPT